MQSLVTEEAVKKGLDKSVEVTEQIELNLAGRYDKYSDFGSAFSPKASLRYQPLDQLMFRTSWSQSFRAPGLDDMTYRQAFMIGCFQCLALWPGFSRSGATISGGMLMGVSRYAASEFSFLLAVPMMMGATALDLYKSWSFLSASDIPMFAVGFVTAFIVALVAIKTFLQLIKRISFIPFAIYRFVVAAAVYVVFF